MSVNDPQAVVAANGFCPRDGSWLDSVRSDYPSCLTCGYEDYSYVLPKRERQHSNSMGGLASSLRYIGFAARLDDLMVSVRLDRNQQSKSGIMTVPTCPWDGKDMKAVPKNGYGKNKGERTFRCVKRHRIILLNSANGAWRGWM
jgi:hypothetical protein